MTAIDKNMFDNRRIRILMVLDAFHFGGAELFNINLLKHIDKNKFEIDYAVTTLLNNELEAQVRNQGANIFIVPKFKGFNYFSYKKQWDVFLSKHKYDIVHGHASGPMSLYFSVAKKHGCINIAHSHSSQYRGTFFERVAKKIFALRIRRKADVWFSCSDLASARLFGKNFQKSQKYHFIPNGVDTEKFNYSSAFRYGIRDKYNISNNDIVIGHVGSFTKPKNHTFLLDFFSLFREKHKGSKLLLCGNGPLFNDIQKKVEILQLKSDVIFAGNTINVEKYYSAMDILVFPSLFEGLPLTLIEAQSCGLPVLCSANISKSAVVTKDIYQKSLNDPVESWVDKAEKILNLPSCKNDMNKIVENSAFSILYTVNYISKLYVDLCEQKLQKDTNSNYGYCK